jgi:hypothetical protein
MFRLKEVQSFLDTRTAEFLGRRLQQQDTTSWDLICKELADEVTIFFLKHSPVLIDQSSRVPVQRL